MYNKVTLVGRIANDLELNETSNGKLYSRFNIAVNRINDGTDFIPVTVWNKQAENLVQYQSKGSLILVDGSISMSNYVDKDGNNRTSFEVMAQNIQFLGNKKDNNSAPLEDDNSDYEKDSIEDPYEDFGETVSIDNDNFLD